MTKQWVNVHLLSSFTLLACLQHFSKNSCRYGEHGELVVDSDRYDPDQVWWGGSHQHSHKGAFDEDDDDDDNGGDYDYDDDVVVVMKLVIVIHVLSAMRRWWWYFTFRVILLLSLYLHSWSNEIIQIQKPIKSKPHFQGLVPIVFGLVLVVGFVGNVLVIAVVSSIMTIMMIF